MSLVTEDAVRALAAFKGKRAPVVSIYLNVDGRRYPRRQDYEAAFDRLVRGRSAQGDPSVDIDMHRVEAHVRAGFDRSHVRGLAMFACSAHDFWEVLELAVPVRNQVVLNHTPHVRQLEAIIHSHERFGVLVVDRQRARMFVFEQGELVDLTERFDLLPRHDDDHGDWDRDHVRDRTAALARTHVRRAARLAFGVFQERAFDHLLLAVPSDMRAEVERELHAYLRDRIADRLTLPASATVAQIQAAALEVDTRIERGKEAAVVARFLDRLGANNGAVAGLQPVLDGLGLRRVETLLVSEGFVVPGWRCWSCDHVAAKGRRCPVCGEAMVAADDVVEEAVEVALGQSCRVIICVANADLDVHGGIGALLRF